jgi:hypothetical protein
MAEKRRGRRVHERWAHLRFSVIGQFLAAPPGKGALKAEIEALSERTWQHPTTGEPVRFGFSTIERWYSAEWIVLRSGAADASQDSLSINRISIPRGARAAHNIGCSPQGADPRRLKEGEAFVIDGVFQFALAIADESLASISVSRQLCRCVEQGGVSHRYDPAVRARRCALQPVAEVS